MIERHLTLGFRAKAVETRQLQTGRRAFGDRLRPSTPRAISDLIELTKLRRRPSAFESDTDSLLFPPDNATRKMAVVRFHQKREPLRDADRGYHIERGPGLG
jgi:hypothetical protein